MLLLVLFSFLLCGWQREKGLKREEMNFLSLRYGQTIAMTFESFWRCLKLNKSHKYSHPFLSHWHSNSSVITKLKNTRRCYEKISELLSK